MQAQPLKSISKAALCRTSAEFDGTEHEFISMEFHLQCPRRKQRLSVRPSESRSSHFDKDELRIAIAKSIKSAEIKSIMGEATLFFGDLRASIQHVACSGCPLNLTLIWAVGEMQPGRFKAALKGGIIDEAIHS